jgi:penicillin-binding protein A
MGRRIRWLGTILTACFGLVLLQLINVQFGKASALSHSGDNPVNRVPNYDNDRGRIFASDGTLLAESVRVAAPGAMTYQFQRRYPTGSLFSQVVGTWSPYFHDTGVEGYYSQQLGLHKQSPENLSQLLSPPPPQTDDVTLTVDPTLQRDAVTELNSILGSHKDGAIVVIVPQTGAVLAMASNPSYDPDPLVSTDQVTEQAAEAADSQQDAEGFTPLDPVAVFNRIEMGSTAKVLTTAAIYNLDPALATYEFPNATCVTVPQTTKPICNDADTASAANSPCGGTIVLMLPQSCDPGYAELGVKLGGDLLSQQADLFGFNSAPPLDIEPDSASAGFVVQPSEYPDAQMLSPSGSLGIPGDALSAFGQQDVLATALENALVAAGIANGGAVMTPHFLEKITDAQGRVIETYQPKIWKQATSARAAAEVIPLMEAVATSGTAERVGFPSNLDVAVKTGTAQVGSPVVTSVADWMIGFAPANNPKVAIAVVVPDQSLGTSGAQVAGPIVKAMLEAALG